MDYLSFCYWVERLLCISWLQISYWIYDLKTTSHPSVGCIFIFWWYPLKNKSFNFDEILLVFFAFVPCAFDVLSKRAFITQGAALVAQMVKYLPAIQETQVWSLGREDSLEKGMATHSSILTFENSVDRGYSPWDCKETQLSDQHFHFYFFMLTQKLGY